MELLKEIYQEHCNTYPDVKSCAFELDLNEKKIRGSVSTNTDKMDFELPHDSSVMVNEIVRILEESSDAASQDVVFHDRGTLESALQDALAHCSYDELFDINYDWEDLRRSPRQYCDQYVLSSLPVQILDEIELDQEIDGLEEEIAKLQQQKTSLKGSSIVMESPISSPSSSQVSSPPSSSPLSSETEDSFSSPKTSKRKRTIKEEGEGESKTRQKKKTISTSAENLHLKVSISTNSQNNSHRGKQKTQIKQKSETFTKEQILVHSANTSSEEEDDEDIDILN